MNRDSEIRVQCAIQRECTEFVQLMIDMLNFFFRPLNVENNIELFKEHICKVHKSDIIEYVDSFIQSRPNIPDIYAAAMSNYLPPIYFRDHPSVISSTATIELCASPCVDFCIALISYIISTSEMQLGLFFQLRAENQRNFFTDKILFNMLKHGTIERKYPEIIDQMSAIRINNDSKIVPKIDSKIVPKIESKNVSRIEFKNVSRIESKIVPRIESKIERESDSKIQRNVERDSKIQTHKLICPDESVSQIIVK